MLVRSASQLGRLARQDVQVVLHNTLAASDYALLDEKTYAPRPNFWGALLWRRLMGTTVLDPRLTNRAGLHVYAHCLRGVPGGVAMLVLNTSRTQPMSLAVPVATNRYTLTAYELSADSVLLNGRRLALGPDDQLPILASDATASGRLSFAPTSITFLTMPSAKNSVCQ